MKTLRCPKCRSENIGFSAGGQTGNYECRDCFYVGPLVLEVEKKMPKKLKNSKL